MAASLLLVEGPAGADKSGLIRSLLARGQLDVAIEFTELWAATRGKRRDPKTGRLPVWTADDPFVKSFFGYRLKESAVALALEQDLRVAVSESSPHKGEKWSRLAAVKGAEFERRTIDPGPRVIKERLSIGGKLSLECKMAGDRWYASKGDTGKEWHL
ncbi:MAG: hypothetical protein OXM01_14860 [Gemmatimonadota bacterium]|nr:hypothetical protein [Gemmatimonadota bacterium]MDE2814308.1 hypothetical protein [Gemmatimonadota bacterium]